MKQNKMNYQMLSQNTHPSQHFYELPNTIPQTRPKKVYQKGKEYKQVINSTLMSNP